MTKAELYTAELARSREELRAILIALRDELRRGGQHMHTVAAIDVVLVSDECRIGTNTNIGERYEPPAESRAADAQQGQII